MSPSGANPSPGTSLLAARGLTKRFPGVVALDDVALTVGRGEVVAVVGENGAGKSTLMKILAGVHGPDAGEIHWCGAPVTIDSVGEASALGIALIHQELNLCDNLSIGANVFLGREPRGALGWFRPGDVDRAAEPFLQRVGLDVPARRPLATLTIGQQQLVEIAKALSQDAKLLIMDEPTSSLSFDEAERLFRVIEELRRCGVAVLYISHRLEEIERIADRVVGMRDGKNSGELERGAIDHVAMVRLMVGRDLEVRPRQRVDVSDRPVRLSVRGLASRVHPEHLVDFDVHAGEIVGMAGLVGAGRTEILETVFGARPAAGRGGVVEVDGQIVPPGDLRAAIAAGMAFVPEDRKQHGLVLEMPIRANATLASLPEHRGGWLAFAGGLDRARERATATQACAELGVRASGIEQPVGQLSGGNQQKVVIGKWLARDAGVLILDEPTRGVDVAAKDEIYRRMAELAAGGMAIVFASSEMAEILALSDRILVMREGRLTGQLDGEGATEEQVMRLATEAVAAVEDA